MSPKKKSFVPSRHFSYVILTIGVLALIGALLFARSMNLRTIDGIAMEHSCSGQLQVCMKSAEAQRECSACIASKGAIRTTICQTCVAAKALCQHDYNVCTDQGGSMHTW